MQVKCPNCQKVINVPRYEVDVVHDCFNQPKIPVLRYEDVPILGPWSDADGVSSTDALTKVPVTRGVIDELDMNPEAKVEHPERVPQYSDRGNPTDTTRERQTFTYINIK